MCSRIRRSCSLRSAARALVLLLAVSAGCKGNDRHARKKGDDAVPAQATEMTGAKAERSVNAAAQARLSGTTDVDVSKRIGDESECTVSQNPNNPQQLFVACNTPAAGLFSARSSDGGTNWEYPNEAKTIAANVDAPILAACCDPSSAWDSFGNLFLAYIDRWKSSIQVIVSKDGGANFSKLTSFLGNVDQPTIVTANVTGAAAPGAVWLVWNQGEDQAQSDDRIDQMVAAGAPVNADGNIGAFTEPRTIPDTMRCSFGDVAIGPTGAVAQACQTPTGGEGPAKIVVNVDPDGLGPAGFGPAFRVGTNVGGIDFIPAQNTMSVDAEAGLAFDRNPSSPHFGWLYLVYSEEVVDEQQDLDVMLLYSKDQGAHWLGPIRVNDDPAGPSQFLPRIAVDDTTGAISVCWYDCRNSPDNTAMQTYCSTASSREDPRFLANATISDAGPTVQGTGYQAGDYMGLAFRNGVAHPIWVEISQTNQASKADPTYEVMTDQVSENGTNPVRESSTSPSKRPKKTKRHL